MARYLFNTATNNSNNKTIMTTTTTTIRVLRHLIETLKHIKQRLKGVYV
jgi:hypothetical protein